MMPLLIFLPVALLLLTGLGILLLTQFRPSIGYSWLIAAVGSLLTVASVIFLRWQMPLQVVLEQWRPFPTLSTPPHLQMDASVWPYVFGLALLALAFILTDSARLETEARPLNWAAGLAITGLGILAVMSANPLTLVLTWTAVDLVELLMVMSTPSGRRMGVQTVTVFAVRVAGTALALVSILVARSLGTPYELTPIPSQLAIFLLLSVGLRLGVLPLNIPYTREVYAWRGLGNLMRMVGPASGLAVLGRMPEQVVPVAWEGVFTAFTILAIGYGAVMWAAQSDELNGRPYWFITLSAMAVACVVNGQSASSIAWGTTLMFTGSMLFLYSARRREILFIPILGLLGMFGLPYTPSASGWSGLVGRSFTPLVVVYILAGLILAWGYWRHMMRPREELYRMERWVHTVYPTGLMFLVMGHWLVGVFGWPGSFTVGVWWTSAALFLLTALGLVLYYTFRGRLAARQAAGGGETVGIHWIGVLAHRAGRSLNAIFRLNWVYRSIGGIYHVTQWFIQTLTTMFEGDGGILWSLVLLALLISLLRAGGAP